MLIIVTQLSLVFIESVLMGQAILIKVYDIQSKELVA